MNKLLLTSSLLVLCFGCDRMDTNRSDTDKNARRSDTERSYEVDNTGKNVRDRNTQAVTPFKQSESEGDRTITQNIRQAIMGDDSLSTNAKNIKVITSNGVVTLRGPVASAEEKMAIERKVQSVRGVSRIDNQIEISGEK